jgi:hypothetical protein
MEEFMARQRPGFGVDEFPLDAIQPRSYGAGANGNGSSRPAVPERFPRRGRKITAEFETVPSETMRQLGVRISEALYDRLLMAGMKAKMERSELSSSTSIVTIALKDWLDRHGF